MFAVHQNTRGWAVSGPARSLSALPRPPSDEGMEKEGLEWKERERGKWKERRRMWKIVDG